MSTCKSASSYIIEIKNIPTFKYILKAGTPHLPRSKSGKQWYEKKPIQFETIAFTIVLKIQNFKNIKYTIDVDI